MFTHQQHRSLGTDAARQRLSAARAPHTGPLLGARGVQAGAGEEAGARGVDQTSRTPVHLLTAPLGAVEPASLTHTVERETAEPQHAAG